MAKGNMLLGYSRGSVGDVTFYRSGGSQRQRARNRQPNNPRTVKQMTQRSKFANAVKFFKQINTGFFKYAFEDRKTNESDYNAFMRHNVVNSGYIGAQASKIADWPALGLWQLSAGSLPEITAPFPQEVEAGIAFNLGVTLSDNITTVGDLSSELINGNSFAWRSGDILTFVIYRVTNASTLPTVDTSEEHRVYAAYGQLIINESDTSNLTEVNATVGGLSFMLNAGTDGLLVQGDDSTAPTIWNNDFIGIAVIHSRNSANGLLVSDSTMVYNKRELPLRAMYDSGTYYNTVIADWQAAANAILQGAAAAVADNVTGWSIHATGPFTKTVSEISIASAEPYEQEYYIKYASAAAAAAGVDLIAASSSGGGTVSITKTVNNDLVTVAMTVTLTQNGQTATLMVDGETAAIIRRGS